MKGAATSVLIAGLLLLPSCGKEPPSNSDIYPFDGDDSALVFWVTDGGGSGGPTGAIHGTQKDSLLPPVDQLVLALTVCPDGNHVGDYLVRSQLHYRYVIFPHTDNDNETVACVQRKVGIDFSVGVGRPDLSDQPDQTPFKVLHAPQS